MDTLGIYLRHHPFVVVVVKLPRTDRIDPVTDDIVLDAQQL